MSEEFSVVNGWLSLLNSFLPCCLQSETTDKDAKLFIVRLSELLINAQKLRCPDWIVEYKIVDLMNKTAKLKKDDEGWLSLLILDLYTYNISLASLRHHLGLIPCHYSVTHESIIRVMASFENPDVKRPKAVQIVYPLQSIEDIQEMLESGIKEVPCVVSLLSE